MSPILIGNPFKGGTENSLSCFWTNLWQWLLQRWKFKISLRHFKSKHIRYDGAPANLSVVAATTSTNFLAKRKRMWHVLIAYFKSMMEFLKLLTKMSLLNSKAFRPFWRDIFSREIQYLIPVHVSAKHGGWTLVLLLFKFLPFILFSSFY